jgi:hypothetical protein
MQADVSFHPAAGPDERPALEVEGAFIFAYVDQDGTLRVSVDLDTVSDRLRDPGPDGTVPLRVTVQGQDVCVA